MNIQTQLRQWLGLGLGSGLLLLSAPAFGSPKLTAQPTPVQFTAPTYEKQVLPKRLTTAEAWQAVAMNALLVKDYQNSLAAYSKAIDLSLPEERPPLLEERGWVNYLAGQFEQASEDFTAAAVLYSGQNNQQAYQNVNQMRRFVELQAQRQDTVS